MNLRHSALTALFLFGLAQTATAQQAGAPPAAVQPAPVRGANLDVSRLPVSLQRIQRELAQSAREREERDGVNLRYIIDVFGQAPPIELFTREDNLRNGPVPYGAPAHKEMIYMMTPQEFRAPVMDLGAAFRWLSDKSRK